MTGETAGALMQRASQARADARWADAVVAYEGLLALRPDLADSWYNLALMRRRIGRFEAALTAYGEALARGVSGPEEVHLNRAVILSDDLARSDDALTELTTALTLAPDYLPALLNLGTLREDRGEREAAEAAYCRALAVDPGNALLISRLAGVTRFAGADDPLLRTLATAMDRPGADLNDRAALGFALGRALDSIAAYDAAFVAYERANAAARAASNVVYDRPAQDAFVDRLIAAFPTAVQGEPDPAVPVFVCGLFRSGSTLVERILAAHSRVTSGGELDVLPRLIRERIQPYPQGAIGTEAATTAGWGEAYLDGVRAARPGADLITDKRPDNFLHIGLIRTLFPGARIVHTTRDPLDLCLSNWFLHLDASMPHAMDLEDLAHWHGQYRRLMSHWKTLYPDIHDVDYDALVAEPRPVVQALLDHLDLPWEDGCLAFHEGGGAVRTASVWQVREPLYQRSSGRRRNYERHLDGLRAALDRG